MPLPGRERWAVAVTDGSGNRTVLQGRFPSRELAEAERDTVEASGAYAGCTVEAVRLGDLPGSAKRGADPGRREAPGAGAQGAARGRKYAALNAIVRRYTRESELFHFARRLAGIKDNGDLVRRLIARPSVQGLEEALAYDPVRALDMAGYALAYPGLKRAVEDLRRDWRGLRGVPHDSHREIMAFCREEDPSAGQAVAERAWLLARVVAGEIAFPEPEDLREGLEYVRDNRLAAQIKKRDGEALRSALGAVTTAVEANEKLVKERRATLAWARQTTAAYAIGKATPEDLQAAVSALRKITAPDWLRDLVQGVARLRLLLSNAAAWSQDSEIAAEARRARRILATAEQVPERATAQAEQARALLTQVGKQVTELRAQGIVCEACGRIGDVQPLDGTGYRPTPRGLAFAEGRQRVVSHMHPEDIEVVKAVVRLLGREHVRLCDVCRQTFWPRHPGMIDVNGRGELYTKEPLKTHTARPESLAEDEPESAAFAPEEDLFTQVRRTDVSRPFDEAEAEAVLGEALGWAEGRSRAVPTWWEIDETEPEALRWGLRTLAFGFHGGSSVSCVVGWVAGGERRETVLLAPLARPAECDDPLIALFWGHILTVLHDVTHERSRLELLAGTEAATEAAVGATDDTQQEERGERPARRRIGGSDEISAHRGRPSARRRHGGRLRPHLVRGFPRRIEGSASPEQRALARRDLGRELPAHGLTYVGTHLRGFGRSTGHDDAYRQRSRVHIVAGPDALTAAWQRLFR